MKTLGQQKGAQGYQSPLSADCHHVVMVGFDDAQVLDITGPLEIFSRAARWLRDCGATHGLPYSVELVAREPGVVHCSSGLQFIATRSYREVTNAHTILLSGGIGYQEACNDTELMAWLRAQYGRVDRLASVCTGTFLLAAAGLITNQTVTTHWDYCERLAKLLPDAHVNADAIFLQAGKLFTSGGVTTGMDMALAMVQSDWGQPVALAVAQELVLYLQRPGGQSQFSRHLAAQRTEHEKIRELQLWILDHPNEDLSIETLAARVSMSPRTLARHFIAELGVAPARFVLEVRVESARRRLEQTTLPIEKVAQVCGFMSAENMRRAFLKLLGVSPSDYRSRFRG